MSELKPCPFCGSDGTIYNIEPHLHTIIDFPDYGGGWFVECTNCTCSVSGSTEEEVRKAWNRRGGA